MASILLVDDERSIRNFLDFALSEEGHVTAEAPDALSRALASARATVRSRDHRPAHARRSTAWRCCARSREQPEVEVIVMTAHGTVDNAVEAMKLGAFEYLQKPLSGPDELRLLVGRALERRGLQTIASTAPSASAEALPPLTYGDPAMKPVVERDRARSRGPPRPCCCSARAAPARRSPRARSTRRAPRAATAVHGDQLRRAHRARCSRASCSATRRARSPARRSAARPARARRRRHVLPRRGRRAQARAAGEAAARAAGAPVRARRRQPHARGRRPLDRRDQPRSARDDRGRHVPRGPLSPARGVPDQAAAAARAPEDIAAVARRRCSRGSRAISSGRCRG